MDAQQIDLTFTKLSQLSQAYGAPAVEMAERVLQRSAVGHLVGGAIFLTAGVTLGFLASKCMNSLRSETYSTPVLDSARHFFGSIIGGALAIAGIIYGIASLADVWAWTALTDPSLALAHEIFGSMGG